MMGPMAKLELMIGLFHISFGWVPRNPIRRMGRGRYRRTGEVIVETRIPLWSNPNIDLNNSLSKYINRICDSKEDLRVSEEEAKSVVSSYTKHFLLNFFDKGCISFDEKKHWFDLEPHFTIGCVFHI